MGRGSFGVVFLAYDPALEREVALKVPASWTLVTGELRERFQREGRAAGALDHPNIVPVFEVGEEESCYIASAYCPGVTLAQWLQDRTDPVPFHDIAQLVATLADAVQHAHERGVLHRDLKPANVLLAPRETLANKAASPSPSASHLSAWSPRITDFGLAKYEHSDEALTRSGAVLGTPCYMAPEQAAGRVAEIGPAVDIYALGAILYRLLTGQPPFQGESDADVLVQVRHSIPTLPSRFRRETPRDLQTICCKCLEKDPQRRYATAEQLANDLRSFQQGRPIVARPVSIFGRLTRWCRREPLAASMLALVAVCVALFAAQWWRAETRADEARESQRQMEASLGVATEAVQQFLTEFSEHELVEYPGMAESRRDLLEQASRFFEDLMRVHAAEPNLQLQIAWAQYRVGFINRHVGSKEKAERALREAIARFEAIDADHPKRLQVEQGLASSEGELAIVLRLMDKNEEAAELFERAAQRFLSLADKYPDNDLFHYYGGRTLVDLARTQAAVDDFSSVKVTLERAAPHVLPFAAKHATHHLYQRNHASWLREHAGLAAADHRYRDAVDGFRKAREIMESPHLRYSTRAARAALLNRLGHVYTRMGDMRQAKDAFNGALRLYEPLHRQDPDVDSFGQGFAMALEGFGSACRDLGDTARAEEYLRRAQDTYRELAETHKGVGFFRSKQVLVIGQIGQLRLRQGEYAEAVAEFEEAKKLLIKLVDEGLEPAYTLVRLDSMLAAAYSGEGRSGDAAAIYLAAIYRARELVEADAGPELLSTLGAALNNYAMMLKRSDIPAAIEFLEGSRRGAVARLGNRAGAISRVAPSSTTII